MDVAPPFWRGKRVLVTGHTGFKGAWLCLWLHAMGAHVEGLAPGPPTDPSLFALARVGDVVKSHPVDVRDHLAVERVVAEAGPEVVVHMAAQAVVRRSFADPRETYETNVMGTVNVLEAVRKVPGVRVVVNVTSDKCYENREWEWGYREDEPMGGHDPYSNSKGCSELVTSAFRRSFFDDGVRRTHLASARAGNVIGGGDWGEDRLVPDIMRAALDESPIEIRHPEAIRPWQHVLNPLSGYLVLAQALWESPAHATGFNFGPPEEDAQPVRFIVERLSDRWPEPLDWRIDSRPHPHEARYLKLDSSRAHLRLGWAARWGLQEAMDAIVDWYLALRSGSDMRTVTLSQVDAFAGA